MTSKANPIKLVDYPTDSQSEASSSSNEEISSTDKKHRLFLMQKLLQQELPGKSPWQPKQSMRQTLG